MHFEKICKQFTEFLKCFFFRSQGAMLSSVRPEYLLEPHDYKLYVKIHEKDNNLSDPLTQLRSKGTMSKAEIVNESESNEDESTTMVDPSVRVAASSRDLNEIIFESVSKRAWTDVLLQIYKVLHP